MRPFFSASLCGRLLLGLLLSLLLIVDVVDFLEVGVDAEDPLIAVVHVHDQCTRSDTVAGAHEHPIATPGCEGVQGLHILDLGHHLGSPRWELGGHPQLSSALEESSMLQGQRPQLLAVVQVARCPRSWLACAP